VSDRLAVLPQYLIPKQALTALAGKFAGARAGGLTTSFIRWFVGRYGVDMSRSGQSRHRRLRQLQRVLHAPAARRRPAAGAGRLHLPGRRGDQPVRRDRARPDLPGQGPSLFDGRAGRRRPRTGGALREWQLRHALPQPARLPSHPHAVRRPPDADDPRARRAVFGQSGDGARRSRSLRAQRAGRLRLRVGARAVCAGAGRRDHRRQHGDGLAWGRQSAASGTCSANGTTATGNGSSPGRRDGPLPARVDGGHAVSARGRRQTSTPTGRRRGRSGSARRWRPCRPNKKGASGAPCCSASDAAQSCGIVSANEGRFISFA
jgi:hypothetical protein